MKIFYIILLLLLFSCVNIYANEKEDLLKGVILERISQFVTYKDDVNDFLICVYQDKKMANIFDDLFEHRKYKGNNIDIENISSLSSINNCDILYVENVSSDVKRKLFTKNNYYTLLVTSEIKSLNDGFMLALYLEENKIRFAINHKALLDANLKINYRLLKVASKVVNPVKSY